MNKTDLDDVSVSSLADSFQLLLNETQKTNLLLKSLVQTSSSNTKQVSRRRNNSVCLSSTDLRDVQENSASHSAANRRATEVLVKYGFLAIDEINTKTQTFNAEVLIQLRWFDESIEEMDDEELDSYLQRCWQPEVQIFNLVKVDVKRQQMFVGEEAAWNNQQLVILRQKIKGTFQTKMLLQDFPFDYQELPITVYSRLPCDQVVLMEDPFEYSYINRNSLNDPQDWKIFGHVDLIEGNPNTITPTNFVERRNIMSNRIKPASTTRETKHNAKSGAAKDAKNVPIVPQLVSTMSSFLTARCRIKRRSEFYVYNVLFAMLTLICLSLVPYGIHRDGIQFRVQTTLTLLLTTFTFRNMTLSILPSTPYFTFLDKYIFGQTSYLSGMVIVYALHIISYRRLDRTLSFHLEMFTLILVSLSQLALHVYLFIRHRNRSYLAKKFIEGCDRSYELKVRDVLSKGPRRRFSTFTERTNKSYFNRASFASQHSRETPSKTAADAVNAGANSNRNELSLDVSSRTVHFPNNN